MDVIRGSESIASETGAIIPAATHAADPSPLLLAAS
jgi:hypothetical protein